MKTACFAAIAAVVLLGLFLAIGIEPCGPDSKALYVGGVFVGGCQ
jgi:hypothetical protein